MLLEKWLLTTSVKETSTLANSGLPYLFGYNVIGQLGDNTVLNENDPSSIGIRSWAQLATGKSHTLGLRSDSYLFTWGVNTLGQLGDQTTVHRSSPVQLGGRFWKSVSTKEDSSYGLRNDGLLFAWGDNSAGQLGINDFKTVSLAKSWTSISTGASHVLAIRSDGMLFTWGLNTGGRLGTNDILHRSSQVQIGTSSWVYVSAGVDHSTAIRSDGTLFVWGDNTSGRLGDNSTLNRSSPVQVSTSSWTSVTAGGIQTAGITTDNQLYVWGTGASGQIGNGSLLNRSQPVQVTSLLGETSIEQYAATLGIDPYPINWVEVESGSSGTASFAIKDDGTLWAWGSNSSGQLGINSTDNKSSPVLVSSESWTQIKSNYEFSIGLRSDGSLWTWGNNANGQLGLGDLVHRSSPVQVGTSSWSQVYAGENASYAIRTDGLLFAWGYNANGILGLGDTQPRSSPIQVGTSSWSYISAGSRMAAGLTTDNILFTWGANSNGELGNGLNGVSQSQSSPIQVTTLLSDESQNLYNATLESPVTLLSWTQVSAGDAHTLAIRSDGRLFAWGDNTNGQLGDNTVFSKSSPAVIGIRSWIAVSAFASSAAIRSDNLLFTWGLGTSGQLGTDDTVSRSSPVQIGINNWSKIAAGFYRFYGILTDGSLYSWGDNSTGSLGDSTTINKSSPTQIGTSSWIAVAGTTSSVDDTAIGIRSDGALFTWGDNVNGAIGQGDVINRSSPVQVTSLTNQIAEQSYATAIGYTITNYSWSQISVGLSHTVAIRADGMLFAWGSNIDGELGDNSTVSTSSPIPIGTSSWTQISAGDNFTVALRTDGAIFAWGDNTWGRLGQGDIVHRSSPVQVGTSSWTQISAGYRNFFAISPDNKLFGVGYNTGGDLAQNDTVHRSSPVQIGTNSWTSISSGPTPLAIRSDGLLFAWGSNDVGQIGQGDIAYKSSPVQITSLAGNETEINNYTTYVGYSGTVYYSWTQISVGANTAAGITSDGMLWTWGMGASGQLGNNSTDSSSKPIMIGNSSWTNVSVGRNIALGGVRNQVAAIRVDGGLFVWGDNTSGALGQGDLIHRSSPTQVGTSSWIAVSSGFTNTFAAIRSGGALFAWGNDAAGVLGQGVISNRSSPVQVGTSSWVAVSVGDQTAAAIRSDSGLFTWGLNNFGQLGSNTILARSSPVQVGTSSWTIVSVGSSITAALRSDSGLFTWGLGTTGQLGSNAILNRSSPVQVGTSSWTQVNTIYTSMNARRTDGAVFSWGQNTGQMGDGSLVNRSSPVQLSSGSSYAVVGLGGGNTPATAMFIRSDGRLFGSGINVYGQLGTNNVVTTSSPVAVAAINDSWSVVAAGGSTCAAIRSDSMLFTWGLGTSGQLGDGTAITKSRPVQIGNSSWISVSSGLGLAMVGLRSDNALFTWGSNSEGQIGDSTGVTANKSSPVQIGTSSWSMISGNFNVGAVRSDGLLFLWGQGLYGQMGNYRLQRYNSPTQLATVNDSWSSIAAGGRHVAAIRSDKLLYTWGYNFAGPIGDGTTVHRSAPVQIGSSSWISVAASTSATAAIRTDNALYTWGDGSLGVIGDNTININRSSPVQIGTSSWSSVSLGTYHASGITADGGLYLWGLGTSGQLGNMRPATQSSPVLVKSVADTWDKISMGDSFMLGIRSDKLLYSWGYDNSGKLGNNTNLISRSAPVQIGSSSWANVSAGSNHATALKYDGSLFTWGSNTVGQLGLGDLLARSSPVQVGTAVADGYYSTYFDGNGDNLSVGTVGSNLSLADFTIEAWVYTTSLNSINAICGSVNSSYSVGFEFTIQTNGSLFFGGQTNNVYVVSLTSSANVITTNTWYHVAFVKNSTQFTMYVNGTAVGTTTSANQWTNQASISIGMLTGIPVLYPFNGYISNFRLVKGSAVYTSDFTPPTTPLTAIENTSLLTCQSSTLIDNSPNNYPVTAGGNAAPSVIQPFNITATGVWYKVSAGNGWTTGLNPNYQIYSWGDNTNGQLGIVRLNNQSSPVVVKAINDSWTTASSGGSHNAAIRSDGKLYAWGLGTSGQLGDTTAVTKSTPTLIGASQIPDGFYSVSFNGTSNYLQIAYDASLKIGTSDFTVEAWVYPDRANKTMCIYTKNGSTGSVSGSFFLGIDTNGKLYYDYNTVVEATSSASIPLNTWTHVAWSRSAGISYLFINGVLDTSVADTTNCYGTGYIRIGYGRGSNSNYWSGKISNLRAVNGVGLYTASFTPQGPLTAISNTALLTCQSVTIRDNSINNLTITNN